MPEERRGKLLSLAVEGVVPVLAGCAGALAGGPEAGAIGGMVGVAVGQSVEKVINFFGGRIVRQWADWFREQTPEERDRALSELASTTPEEARKQAEDILDRIVLEPIGPADRDLALSYLSLLPGSIDRALCRPSPSGVRSLPQTISVEEPQQLLSILPLTLPPYSVGAEVRGTPYRLDALLGTGGFGAVYRASTRSLQHLPLAIKFCLDSGLALALRRERDNLERLMKAGGEDWSPRIVRLYGYDLDHETPYLVYEFVTGGDLIRYLTARHEKLGRPLGAAEIFALITQVAEALAFAHDKGIVHRDLKPANVLVEGGVIKLADFGLGGVNAVRAAQVSRIGATTVDQLSLSDQASLFRGAGTPLYMAPEQRRGLPPDPRHDLYSLGVMWYQLLVGDVARELHPGWAKELTLRYKVPKAHIELIDACVGYFDERPKHAGELLTMMRDAGEAAAPAQPASPPPSAVPAVLGGELKQALLRNMVKELLDASRAAFVIQDKYRGVVAPAGGIALVVFVLCLIEHSPIFLALLGSLLSGVVTAVIAVAFCKARTLASAERIEAQIAALAHEFPAVVAGWGGPTVLRDRALVEEIVRRGGLGDLLPLEPSPPLLNVAASASADQIRESLLANKVEELRVAHRSVWTLKAKLIVILGPAVPIALVVLLVGANQTMSQLSALGSSVIFGGMLSALGSSVIFGGMWATIAFIVLASRTDTNAKKIEECIATLQREFPAAVAGWGGPTVLRDRALVEQIAHKMGLGVDPLPPARRAAPNSTPPASGIDPARRPLAVEQLRELRRVQQALHDYGPRKTVPWPLAISLGLLLGIPAGLGVGSYVHTLTAPQVFQTYAKGRFDVLYSARGTTLDESGFFRENRYAILTAALAGVGSGVGVAVAISLLLGVRPWYRWRLLVSLALAAPIAVPLGTGFGLLYHSQIKPYITGNYTTKVEYYNWRGSIIDAAFYQREAASVLNHALMLGFSSAVVLLFALTLAFHAAYARRATAAGVAVEEQARRTAEAFPELAAAGGGVEGLSRPGSARQLLLGMGEAV